MRSPRRNQRFPGGGKELFELMRMDHQPQFVNLYPQNEISRERAKLRDTLTYEPEFDPMLYFWPVDHAWVIADFQNTQNDDTVARLVKALKRDGALVVTIIWRRLRTSEERELGASNWLYCPEWKTYGDALAWDQFHAGPLAPSA